MNIESVDIGGNWTDMEARMMVSAINRYGDGGHPWADGTTLRYFNLGYVLSCCWSALDRCRPEYVETLQGVISKLERIE